MAGANHFGDAEGDERSARRPNPVDVHVGSRVRLRRMLLGLSQEKLADQLGLTFQQVQKYEKGINRIGASRLFELGRVLGVGVDYFYKELIEDGIAPAAPAPGLAEAGGESFVIDFLSSREGIELNRAFVRISDARVRRAVVEMVRAVAGEDRAG